MDYVELEELVHKLQTNEEKIIELVKVDQISLPRRPEWRGY